MDARLLNSKEEARQTLMIGSCMKRGWPVLTPRHFTDVLKEILPTLTSAELLSTRLRRDEAPTAITSVTNKLWLVSRSQCAPVILVSTSQ